MSADQAYALLEPYFPHLRRIVDGGWRYWESFSPEQRLALDLRAQRSCTWCGMVQEAIAEFAEDQNVKIIPATNTTYFEFAGEAIVRFKKLDRKGTSANVMTQTQLDLRDPQVSLPGEFGELPFLDVGYVPNVAEDGYEAILVASPGNGESAWNFAVPTTADREIAMAIDPAVEETSLRPIAKPKTGVGTGTEGR